MIQQLNFMSHHFSTESSYSTNLYVIKNWNRDGGEVENVLSAPD